MNVLTPYQCQFQPLPSEPPPPYTPSPPSYTPRASHHHNNHRHIPPTVTPHFLCSSNPPSHLSDSTIARYGVYLTTLHHSATGTTHLYRLCPRVPTNSKPGLFAVKIISSSSPPLALPLLPKFNTLNSTHPNVLLPFLPPIIDDAGNHHLITPYCAGGTLHNLVHTTTRLAPEEANCFFKQLLQGVAYLHKHPPFHNPHHDPLETSLDLTPESILLTGEGAIQIKVRLPLSSERTHPPAGRRSPYYAPEALYSLPHESNTRAITIDLNPKAIDTWALGIIYLFMRTGHPAWSVASAERDRTYAQYLRERTQEGGFTVIEGLGTEPCRNVIYAMLDPKPSRRLTVHQALRSEWMYGAEICDAGGMKG
ncbi:kinase-like protein [Aspergillus saccharolyticus JOP 1030-1]|uniref:non-specific serine/threonine protein kinase n=1 Tax=Aspergillus saccharolyticus JOP 1030-1 TaxID=1450539 RepID=A0A318ZRG2_9EURO|nr:kinase-like protein [Aspergillus saccharolyticus JOP 1030-1]PYH46953.1 kinase-like protein [Aspergillus saccharolyticus JOP 1030-1]